MADLKQTRMRVVVAVSALVVVDVACAAMLLTPIAGRASVRQAEMQGLWISLKQGETAPWRGLDKKLPEARQDIQAFYQDRFPSGYSAISTTIDGIASQSGVKITSERYSQKDSDMQNLQKIEVDADVSGDYLQMVKFINTVERSKLFFIIDSLELAGEQTGPVKLHMKLETYKRTA